MQATPHSLSAAEQRTARLDARLALYAQYAALLGQEMTAAWSADPARAAALTRELAQARAELAEQYDELRGWPGGAAAVSPEGFPTLFAEAVTELEHQQTLDQALRAQAGALRPDGALLLPASPDTAATDDSKVETAEETDGVARLGGALVAARSSGVGGMLGGQYPGVAAGVPVFADEPSVEERAAEGRQRLDVKF